MGFGFSLDAIASTCYVRCRFARSANAHLSDDETVAKMGCPKICYGLDLGHPSTSFSRKDGDFFPCGRFLRFSGGFGENGW